MPGLDMHPCWQTNSGRDSFDNFMRSELFQIFEKYIAKNAPYEIPSIEDKDWHVVKDRIDRGDINLDMYQIIERNCMLTLRQELYPKFLKSKFFFSEEPYIRAEKQTPLLKHRR